MAVGWLSFIVLKVYKNSKLPFLPPIGGYNFSTRKKWFMVKSRLNKFTPIALFVLVGCAFTVKQITNWNIASNYSIKFSGSKVVGILSGLKGTIMFNENDLKNSKMDIEVDVTTIKTGKDGMDEHAKNSSWFDAAKYPKITFKSSGFTKAATGFLVQGELTLHGVKKLMSIPFTFINRGNRAEFVGNFKINRKDYGINGNSFGFMVGTIFDVQLSVPVIQ
jgi:polyisoprenoid-binding protein YceI